MSVVTLDSLEHKFKDISEPLDVFNSKEFWMVQFSVSIFQSFKPFVKYMDAHRTRYSKLSGGKWMNFLQEYHDKSNFSDNVLSDYLNGVVVSSEENKMIQENLLWVIRLTRRVFAQLPEDSKPYLYDSLFAGEFYLKMFLSVKYMEKKMYEIFGKEDEACKLSSLLSRVKSECDELESIKKVLSGQLENPQSIEQQTQLQIAAMWYRTVDFVQEQLNDEIDIIEDRKQYISTYK